MGRQLFRKIVFLSNVYLFSKRKKAELRDTIKMYKLSLDSSEKALDEEIINCELWCPPLLHSKGMFYT